MAPESTERRRELAVDLRVRRLYMLVLALAAALVVVYAALVVAIVRLRPSLPPGFPRGMAVALGAGALAIVVASLALGGYATVQTHRMVGAASRLSKALHDLADGKSPEPLALRPNDYLQDVAAELNRLATRLKGKSA